MEPSFPSCLGLDGARLNCLIHARSRSGHWLGTALLVPSNVRALSSIHSARRVMAGSTREARQAGVAQADRARPREAR